MQDKLKEIISKSEHFLAGLFSEREGVAFFSSGHKSQGEFFFSIRHESQGDGHVSQGIYLC